MIQKLVLAFVILSFASPAFRIATLGAQEPSPPTPRGEVMILGSYHMSNPGADDVNAEADDVTSPKRQRELETLADDLARFAPDRIAVELPETYADSLETWFEQYTGDSLTSLPTSELDQVAFRLAEKLGHDRVYPVDHRMGLAIKSVMAYAEEHGMKERVPAARRSTREAVREMETIQREGTVGDIFRYLNSPAFDRTHAFYMVLATVGEGDEYPGAEMVADWYERNLKIFTNVWRLTREPAVDRVLVLIGAGHGTLLRRFVRDAPDLELVPAAPYIGTNEPDESAGSR